MPTYTIRADNCKRKIAAETLDDAINEAREWLAVGHEGGATTRWVNGYLTWTDAEGDEVSASVKATIEPTVPECSDADHAWEDLHVHGNGGGVLIVSSCPHCACTRTVNTWAHDPSTGEQGLESVTYREGSPS